MSLFLLPGFGFALLVALPLAALAYRAAAAGDLLGSLRKPIVHEALRLSMITSGLTLAITVALGTPLAYVLARASFPGKRVLDTLVDLPIVLPPVVAGVALLMAFGRRGLLGEPLRRAGVELAFTTAAVVIAEVFVSAPFYIRAAKAGFQSVDETLEGIAYTLGASRWRAFVRVTLPLALPSLASGAVLCWARALSEFGNFRGRTQTMPLAILTAMESDLNAALAIAVILLLASFLVLLLIRSVGRGDVSAHG